MGASYEKGFGFSYKRGGRTCHAAIIARELGIPAIVGSVNATELLTEQDTVTVSCSEGETGIVYQGELDFEVKVFKRMVIYQKYL